MSISANIDGKSLLKALNAFPKNIQKNVMVGATRAAANVVRDRARELVPKRTKNLAKSIVAIQQKVENGQIKFSVTPSRGGKYDGWYAHFVEFGTVKMSANPFMRPAMEQTQDESLNAAKEYIAKRIPEEIMRSK